MLLHAREIRDRAAIRGWLRISVKTASIKILRNPDLRVGAYLVSATADDGTIIYLQTDDVMKIGKYPKLEGILSEPVNDTCLSDIVGRHLHLYSIPYGQTNKPFSHLSRERWASTRWLLESCTRNIVPGSTAVIFPSTTIELSVRHVIYKSLGGLILKVL